MLRAMKLLNMTSKILNINQYIALIALSNKIYLSFNLMYLFQKSTQIDTILWMNKLFHTQ